MLPRARVFWPALIGTLSLLDWMCGQGEPNGDTISELTRSAFRVDTPHGRIAFTAAVIGGAVWFRRHILH